MKRALIAAVAAVVSLSPALAADIPAAPPPVYRAPVVAPPVLYNWSGFYIGVNGGYGWSNVTVDAGVVFDVLDLRGPVAGGQVGFNYQAGNFVVGIELDGQWANIRQEVGGVSVQLDGFATARLRAGAAIDNFLLYATGGGAFVWASATDGVDTVRGNRWGWTAGAGAETGFGPWSLRAEYLFIQTFSEELLPGVDATLNTHIARAALNYRFGGGPVSARY